MTNTIKQGILVKIPNTINRVYRKPVEQQSTLQPPKMVAVGNPQGLVLPKPGASLNRRRDAMQLVRAHAQEQQFMSMPADDDRFFVDTQPNGMVPISM